MGATMDCYMNGYSDPRLAAYFVPASSDNKYHGVRLGVHNMNPTRYAGVYISNLNIDRATTPIVWMTVAEAYFLRSEAALRGWNMGGTAKTFYEAGIRASFNENGVGGEDAYIANSTLKPTRYVDRTGSNNGTNAPSDITIAWNDEIGRASCRERV